MNIIEKYNQDKETTIQADISEFLHFKFSNYIMQQLKCRKDPNVKKLLKVNNKYFFKQNRILLK